MGILLLFSCSVMSDSLQPPGPQHICEASLPRPSPCAGVCPRSCPLHQWYCANISSSNSLFSFCPWYFLASGLSKLEIFLIYSGCQFPIHSPLSLHVCMYSIYTYTCMAYMCICVYMCVCIYVYICICVYTCIYSQTK